MNLRQPPPGVPVPAGDLDDGPTRAISVTDARPSRLIGQAPREYRPVPGRETPPRDPAWRAAPRQDTGHAAPPWEPAGRPAPPWQAAGRAAAPRDQFPDTTRRRAAESAAADGRRQAPGRRQAAGGRHAGAAPVFADLSGRRLRLMRLAGMATAGVLLACLAVMAVGLPGGPGASFMPWATHRAQGIPPGPGTAGSARPGSPAASPAPAPGVPQPRASASAGHSAAATTAASAPVSPAPLVTNAVGKAPPGRNRFPSPRSSPKHPGAA